MEDRSRRQTQEAQGGSENEESYFCTSGGAVDNSLQHALRAELLTHCLGKELRGLYSSITIPISRNPPCSSIHLCASASPCSSTTTALSSHCPLNFFPSQTSFHIGGHQTQQKTWRLTEVKRHKATGRLPQINYHSYAEALPGECTPRLL